MGSPLSSRILLRYAADLYDQGQFDASIDLMRQLAERSERYGAPAPPLAHAAHRITAESISTEALRRRVESV